MSRAGVSVISDAITIEDEVWQEAFATRVPSSRRSPSSPSVAAAVSTSPVVALPTAPAGRRPAGEPTLERRTVTIRGHGAERNLPWPGESPRRPARAAYERHGFQPDRMAMWAMVLGLLLVLIAVISSHA